MTILRYSDTEIATVYKVIEQRRDMRHFVPTPVDPEILAKLLAAAHHAPSVGLMQPWRFIRITDLNLRKAIYEQVQQERLNTAQALGESESVTREAEFMRLKVEGIMQCGEVIIAALCDHRETHIFGRRTLPEMDLASVSCAIQNMWLAARAEGLGMGWVSMFEPTKLGMLLQIPQGAKPVAILCLGHVDKFYEQPMLVETGWITGKPLSDMISENIWHK